MSLTFNNRQTIGPFTVERCADLSPGTVCPSDVFAVVTDPAGGGKGKVAKFVLRKNYERSEVRAQQNGRPRIASDPPVELWYGWRLYLPSDFDPTMDTNPKANHIIVTQWHQDNTTSFYDGAPTVVRINNDNTWRLNLKYQPDLSVESITSHSFNLGSINSHKGKWTNFVMHVKWTKNLDGFLRLWMNGRQVIGGGRAAHQWENKPTFWDTPKGVGFKMGMYKGDPWTQGQSPKVIYADDYRLGNARARYEDVAPGNASLQPDARIRRRGVSK